MSIKHLVARTLNGLLHPFDLHLGRLSEYPFKSLSMDAVLERFKARGHDPLTIIDIGASDGRWSKNVMKFYPDVHYHLIEANVIHEAKLIKFAATHKNCTYKIAAAADTVGHIYFDDSDLFTGLATHENDNDSLTRVPCTTIDEEVNVNTLKGPFLLKLDTHGFEVPIFEGAQDTMGNTSVIIVEAYNFDLTGESLKFWELCEFLLRKGFRPVDLMEPMFRPEDEVLWQLDLVFMRSDSDEFEKNTYD